MELIHTLVMAYLCRLIYFLEVMENMEKGTGNAL